MFGFGKKSHFLFTEHRTTGERKLNPQLTKEMKASLGPTRKEEEKAIFRSKISFPGDECPCASDKNIANVGRWGSGFLPGL